jgi:hypothetical protein
MKERAVKKQHHVHEESKTCCCNMLADAPSENCPIHAFGIWPPRCAICGQMMNWEEAHRKRNYHD